MSSMSLDPCDYDMRDYNCSYWGYECEDDGDYGGYDDNHDQESNGNASYYSGGEYEEDGDNSSYSVYGEDDEPTDDSYDDDDGACERSFSHSKSKVGSYDGDETYYTSHPKDEG